MNNNSNNSSNSGYKKLNSKVGFLFAVLANILWGSSFLASKYTLLAWKPFTSSSLRFGIATIALFVTMKFLGKKIEVPQNRKQWTSLFWLATSAFGFLYPLQLSGLKFITSGFSAAIMLTSPLVVLILGKVLLKEELSNQKWIALGLGVVGGSVLLMSVSGLNFTMSSEALLGSFLTFLSACSLALSVILTRKCSKDFSSGSITLWTMLIGFIELTLSACIFEGNIIDNVSRDASLLSWTSLFFLALVCSAFCFFIWNYALSKSSPQEIASSMHIKTPTAVLIGIFIANEALTIQIVLGTVLVMLGVWYSQARNSIK